MRNITIQELTGYWRSKQNKTEIDLTIREENNSIITISENGKNSKEYRGVFSIQDGDNTEIKLIRIGQDFTAKILHLNLEHEELIINLDAELHSFKKYSI
jgi:hypothetical protein